MGLAQATRKVSFLRGTRNPQRVPGAVRGARWSEECGPFSLEPARTASGQSSAEGIPCLESAAETTGFFANRAKFNVLQALESVKNEPANG